jgi:NAD kinase
MPSVERVAVITHGRDKVDEALARVAGVAARLGVEVVDSDDADLAVVLGGDGTMLGALKRFLG